MKKCVFIKRRHKIKQCFILKKYSYFLISGARGETNDTPSTFSVLAPDKLKSKYSLQQILIDTLYICGPSLASEITAPEDVTRRRPGPRY